MKQKDCLRLEWSRIIERNQAYQVLDTEHGRIGISLLKMLKVNKPLYKQYADKNLCLAADGYSWLFMIFENYQVGLTVMLDEHDMWIQLYFDVADQTKVGDDNSYLDDLYLDVVVLNDKSIYCLDHDELDLAYQNQVITDQQYLKASNTEKQILDYLENHLDELVDFIYDQIENLSK